MDDIQEWSNAQARVIELVTAATPEQVATRVPACPDWTVRDLLSHMVGVGASVVDGDEPDDHNETWTRRHIERRAERSVEDLVAEWGIVADPLRDWMRANNTRPLFDVTIHEQDLRGALTAPGAQDTPAMATVRERFVGRFADGLANDAAPIALVGDSWSWVSAGDIDNVAVVVRAPEFDLTRALMARRSAAQLRTWTERGDVTPYLDAFATVGPLPDADLSES